MDVMVFLLLILALCFALPAVAAEPELYELPLAVETRWFTYENPTGAPGAGGQANQGAKGAAFEPVEPGETKILLDFQGSGTIRRMWIALPSRDPISLRSYVIRIYWDGAEKPAVEAPFGDFFGAVLGRPTAFHGAFFSNMEGRSFNSFVPMPFRTSAKVTFTNESGLRLSQLFYEIDCTINETHSEETGYFHAYWHRDEKTALGEDFAILPPVTGKGRYLGAHIGVMGYPELLGWWGEGEVKAYLDGDTDLPTLVNTGTEDYIGTAYEQGVFDHPYMGALIVDNDKKLYTFYRYHVPDPVFFHKAIRVTIQQLGGAPKKDVVKMLEDGVEIRPVSTHDSNRFVPLLEAPQGTDLASPDLPSDWTNFYRRDDVCATAFFYLDRTESDLPPIQDVTARTANLLRAH